jgi:hypothetical protein
MKKNQNRSQIKLVNEISSIEFSKHRCESNPGLYKINLDKFKFQY